MTVKKYPCICEYELKPDEKRIFNTVSGFMFIYVREGAGMLYLNDEESEFAPGTAVLMSCLDYVCIKSSGGTVRLTVLEFSEDAFSGRILEFFSLRNLPLVTAFES